MKDQAITRAERLRAVISMPEYEDTIGKWIDDGFDNALHDMTEAKEPHQFHSAQGAYKALLALKESFQRVFDAEEAAVERHHKKMTKKG